MGAKNCSRAWHLQGKSIWVRWGSSPDHPNVYLIDMKWKSSREIKNAKAWYFLWSYCIDEMVVNVKQGSLSGMMFTVGAPENSKFGKITQNKGHFAVRGHSRSPILVPIQSSYTASYIKTITRQVLRINSWIYESASNLYRGRRAVPLQRFTTRHTLRKLSIVMAVSTTFAQFVPETTKFGKITLNMGHFTVQGHPRSPILVPIESSYTTSY